MPSSEPRPRRVLRTVLVALAVLAVGVGALGVIGYCSVLGCTLFSEDFEPRGEKATASRAAATASVTELAEHIAADRPVLAETFADGCVTGQNNWKRKDTFSHDCSVASSRVVVLTNDRAQVSAGLTEVDAVVRGLGCTTQSPRGGLDRVRDEYWREDNPQVVRYGAAGLPGSVYQCPKGRTVEVDPTSAAESSSEPGVALGGTFVDHPLSQDGYTTDDVRALKASGAQLALVVTVTQSYYRTRF